MAMARYTAGKDPRIRNRRAVEIPDASRLVLARELGAIHTIDASRCRISLLNPEVGRGADAAIGATGKTNVLEQAILSTAVRLNGGQP